MFIPRNDEQIKVGTTVGLVAGASGFTFDGSTAGLPDYRNYEIVISELNGRGIMVKGLDYSWDYTTAQFQLLHVNDKLQIGTYYNVHFENPIIAQPPFIPNALIDWSYFIRDIMIPNLDASKPTSAPMIEIAYFIQKYEPQCLRMILGYDLYKKVLTESSQRIDDLVNGAEFTDNEDKTQKWDGLIQPSVRVSLIANYVYFYHQEYKKAQTTGVGTSLAKQEAGTAVSPAEKMTLAWNFISKECLTMSCFLWTKKDLSGSRVYPEFDYTQYLETRRKTRRIDSVFQF